MGKTGGIAARFSRDVLLYFIALFALAIDQTSKFLIRAYLPEQESFPVDAPIRFSRTVNTGAAFSLLQGHTLLLVLITFIVIGIILTYDRFLPSTGRLIKLSLGLQLGGALGNLVDRLLFGRVTDFIATDFWPTFNLADSCIVIGVGILIFLLVFSEKEKGEPLRPSHDKSESLPS